jgi:hypothetical protein
VIKEMEEQIDWHQVFTLPHTNLCIV